MQYRKEWIRRRWTCTDRRSKGFCQILVRQADVLPAIVYATSTVRSEKDQYLLTKGPAAFVEPLPVTWKLAVALEMIHLVFDRDPCATWKFKYQIDAPRSFSTSFWRYTAIFIVERREPLLRHADIHLAPDSLEEGLQENSALIMSLAWIEEVGEKPRMVDFTSINRKRFENVESLRAKPPAYQAVSEIVADHRMIKQCPNFTDSRFLRGRCTPTQLVE